MANLVVHFEIHASEPQRLIDFYSGLLGWRFSQFGETPYWTIETGRGRHRQRRRHRRPRHQRRPAPAKRARSPSGAHR